MDFDNVESTIHSCIREQEEEQKKFNLKLLSPELDSGIASVKNWQSELKEGFADYKAEYEAFNERIWKKRFYYQCILVLDPCVRARQ